MSKQCPDVVLHRVYGPTQTLRAALLTLASANPELLHDLNASLSVRGDGPRYLEVLDRARAVLDNTAPALPASLSLSQHSPQQEVSAMSAPHPTPTPSAWQPPRSRAVPQPPSPPTPPAAPQLVFRAIDELVRGNKENVLRSGYRKVRGGCRAAMMPPPGRRAAWAAAAWLRLSRCKARPWGWGKQSCHQQPLAPTACLDAVQRRPGPGGAYSATLRHAEAWCSSGAQQLLLGQEWQLLLARVGDALMLHLLLHTSIFLWLPNNNYVQVAGKAIQEVRGRWPAGLA
jgi:hypothetical protein